MPDLTIREYQAAVDRWVKKYGVRYFSELTNTAILAEEVGELARLMARLFGDQNFKPSDPRPDLGDEIADILFVLFCIANQTGVDVTAALKNNLAKKTKRDSSRHWENPKLTS